MDDAMSGFRTPPIKRHAALVPFSRDHYVGLVHAHRLIKAASKDRVARHRALADFLDAWTSEIQPHLRDEERLLPPLIAGADDRRRLLDEHAQLAQAAEQAAIERRAVDPDPSFVERLGRDLEQHIRWEERVLFDLVQEHATEDQLESLSESIAQFERSRNLSGSNGPPQVDASEPST